MKVIYAQEPVPKKNRLKIGYSVFLAGPTPRDDTLVPSWRPDVLKALQKKKHLLLSEVLIPEPRDGIFTGDYLGQVNWEEAAIDYCDILVFWIPRNIKNKMPAFTTNVEFGWWLDKKENIVMGWPKDAEKVKYLEYKFKKHRPNSVVHHSIEDLVEEIISLISSNY